MIEFTHSSTTYKSNGKLMGPDGYHIAFTWKLNEHGYVVVNYSNPVVMAPAVQSAYQVALARYEREILEEIVR